MKEHQVIEMLHKVIAENTNFTTWTVSTPHLVALVNHAIEAEREACAKIVDEWFHSLASEPEMEKIAEQIRARGQA
jgi:hypothetical protein